MAGVVTYSVTVGDNAYTGGIAYTVRSYQEFTQATATTDTAVSMGGVTTCDALFLKSDQALTLNINSSAGTDITVDASKPLILCGSAITALYLSNASGSTANIIIDMYGA